jgi:DNA end-binding protein Ku
MPRSSWKGYLKLSLVSVPVKGYTANVSASDVALNQLHSECHSRIKYKKTCPIHGEIPKEEIVSGYEYAEGQYVVIEPEELAKIRGERERAVTLDAVVPLNSVEPVHFSDKTYYLVPDGKVGQKPFALIQQCLTEDKLQAVGRVVLFGREELVLVRPVEGLLAMTALKYESQIAHPSMLAEELEKPALKSQEIGLTKTLLEAFVKDDFSLASYQDTYVEKLTELIQAKVEGKEVVTPPAAEEPHVINLMDALKRSVAAARKSERPASGSRKPARKTSTAHARPRSGKRKRKTG